MNKLMKNAFPEMAAAKSEKAFSFFSRCFLFRPSSFPPFFNDEEQEAEEQYVYKN